MIDCDNLQRIVREVGREATGGREQLTIREVFELYGGSGSGASARLSRELGVSQRQVQRYVTGAQQKRGMGPKGLRYFRELSDRELLRAGIRELRQHPLTFEGEFALCYGDEQQGDERELRGDAVAIADNDEWLDALAAGDCDGAAGMVTDLFLEAYGVSAADLDVCDEDSGQNLHASA